MANFFETDIGIIIDDTPIGNELQLCECGFEECRPTKPYEFALIDYWAIHYCIDGEGSFQIRDKQNNIHAGDIFAIPPHTKNKYFPDASNPWSYRWIGLRGPLAEEILSMCGLTAKNYILHYKVDSRLEDQFETIYDDLQKNHKVKALGRSLQLLDYIQHNVYHSVEYQLTSGELYFNEAIHFIHKNYFHKITISDIAAAANIDRTYMFKLFQKYVKQSPSQYLQQYRLDKASVLLRKSPLSITDISYAVGFQHPPYFTKLYTQYKGMTPSEYRKGFLLKENSSE